MSSAPNRPHQNVIYHELCQNKWPLCYLLSEKRSEVCMYVYILTEKKINSVKNLQAFQFCRIVYIETQWNKMKE